MDRGGGMGLNGYYLSPPLFGSYIVIKTLFLK